MFGMGGSEIIVILIVALLFLGPEKLPSAAKSISKGIRDIKKQSRALQQQLESDEQIGGAIRDLKSALRGEEIPAVRPKKPRPALPAASENTIHKELEGHADPEGHALVANGAGEPNGAHGDAKPAELPAAEAPAVTLPVQAGEPDAAAPAAADDAAELAAMIKPASGTVAKGS